MDIKEHQYFRFIETLLWWEGRFQTSLLQQQYQLSRPSASKYLSRYLATYQIAANYDETEKAYCLSSPFTPSLISQNFAEYMQLTNMAMVTNLGCNHVLSLPIPQRKLDPNILRPILTACRRQSALDICYRSIKEQGETERIIRPHTLVNTGLRYHVRAYCEANGDFRDFSLSRIIAATPEHQSKAKKFQQHDSAWQTPVTLTIMPDPRLSDYAQQVIADDFNMQNGRAELITNAALVNYLIALLRLDCQHPTPEAQQIVITPDCYRHLRQQGLLWNA